MMGVARELVVQGGAIYNKYAEIVGGAVNPKDGYLQIKMTEVISANFEKFRHLDPNLRQIDYNFLGMKLSETPNWKFFWQTNWSDPSVWVPGLLLFLLPVASGVLAYFSSKIGMALNQTPGNDQQQQSTKSMMLMMPLISVYFGFVMPGAIGVYMIAQTVFYDDTGYRF
jgi:YidC/Oxa1 family membrane protein insertase